MSPERKDGRAGDWTRAVREAGPYLGLGTSLAASVLLGVGAGHWLDKRLGTEPWLLLVGAMLGLAAAGVQLVKIGAIRKP